MSSTKDTTNNSILDDDMTHICDEIGIKKQSKTALVCAGITTFQALLAAKDAIAGLPTKNSTTLATTSTTSSGNTTDISTTATANISCTTSTTLTIKDECRAKLLNVIDWYNFYMQENAKSPDFLNDFTDEVLEKFCQDIEAKNALLENYVERILGSSSSKSYIDYVDAAKYLRKYEKQYIKTMSFDKKRRWVEGAEAILEHFESTQSTQAIRLRQFFQWDRG